MNANQKTHFDFIPLFIILFPNIMIYVRMLKRI